MANNSKTLLGAIALSSISLTACFDAGLEISNGISIEAPSKNTSYIGFENNPSPSGANNTLPQYMVINYESLPEKMDIFLNGFPITDVYMQKSTTQAKIDTDLIKDFLIQGENLLSINPLTFGPNVKFQLDSQGPTMVIKNVCSASDIDCPAKDDQVHVEFSVFDPSTVTDVRLQNQVATLSENLYKAIANNPVEGKYEFTLNDENGYQSSYQFLSNGEYLPTIFKARVGETAIKGLTPVINAGISHQLSEKTPEEVDTSDYLYAGNYGILKLWVKVKSMATGRAYINDLNFDDNTPNLMHMDLSMIPAEHTGYTDNNKKDNSMVTSLKEDVGTYIVMDIYTTCSWANHPDDALSCKTKMMPDMTMLMETMDFTGSIDLDIQDGTFGVKFRDGMSIDIGDFATNEDGAQDFMGQIINMLKGTDLFQNLIRSLVETVMNENLEKIYVGTEIFNTQGYSFALETTAENITTDANDMYVEFSGRVHTTNENPNIPKALGSYYIDKNLPGLINDPDTDIDNLAVTVNANMINQGLTTLYQTGSTHLNILNGEILLGPNAVDDTMGNNNDIKISLYPSSPGIFKLTGSNTSQASLTYDAATMIISQKKDGRYKELFSVNVNISAGVLMRVVDDVFRMTISGSPDFKINSLTNNTGLPISDTILSWALDQAITWAIPQVAKTEQDIKIPDIEGEDYNFKSEITTQEFNTDGGHLNFSMGITPVTIVP